MLNFSKGQIIHPWKALGVHRQSSMEDIQAAFRARASKLHPDSPFSDSVGFHQVNDAYQCLKSAQKTTEFVERMVLFGRPCPECKGAGAKSKSVGVTGKTYTGCTKCGGCGYLEKEKTK